MTYILLFLRKDVSPKPTVDDVESKRKRKEYPTPDFTYLQIDIFIRTLQTDKKKRNVLTLSRDAVVKLISIPDEKSDSVIQSANMLDINEQFYIEAGYLLFLIFVEIGSIISDLEGSQLLSGTEGIWDVSTVFILEFFKYI